MSRKFDEYMGDYFDLYGTEYKLIEPQNAEELVQALEVKSALKNHISGLMHDEDSSSYESFLQEQEDFIKEYIGLLGEFDSRTLASNIAFLCRKNDMRIGDLEDTLGISAGYISRTIKKNSKKKMSIDIVWKIAQLFGTDVRTITESEMWVSHTNTDLLEMFLERLYQDTRDNYFVWESDGGYMIVLKERYSQMGLVTEEEEKAVYHPNHLNQERTWLLSKDIVCLECFEGKKDLAIIPYKMEGDEKLHGYDFIFVWEDEDRWCWEKVFYTGDDPFQSLQEGADKLYNLIENSEYDVKLSPKVHRMISRYVESGRPE